MLGDAGILVAALFASCRMLPKAVYYRVIPGAVESRFFMPSFRKRLKEILFAVIARGAFSSFFDVIPEED